MSEVARQVLVVLKDGAPLPEDEARALWTEFSEHMELVRGDMAGFARSHGWVEVRPEYRRGQAVLIVSTTPEAAAKAAPPPPPPPPPPKPKAAAPKPGGTKGGAKPKPARKGAPPKGGKPVAKKKAAR